MAVALKPPSELPKKGNLGENWRQWRQNFEIYLIASQLDVNDATIPALFLHTIGQYGRDIYNEVTTLQPATEKSLQELFEIFENYCNPKTNLTYNRYKFFHTNQAKNEPFDKFLSSLQKQSRDCDFGELNSSLMITQIISGLKNTTLRETLLNVELDLNGVIEKCRLTEKSEIQAQQMACAIDIQCTPVAAPKPDKKPVPKSDKKNPQPHKDKKPKGPPKNIKPEPGKIDLKYCKFCGGSHVYGNCPAFGIICGKCSKPNHLPRVCKN